MVSFGSIIKFKLSEVDELGLISFRNGATVVSHEYSKNDFFWSVICSTFPAHNFSFKAALKNLQEVPKFGLVSSRNGTTVISQSTVTILFYRCLTNIAF